MKQRLHLLFVISFFLISVYGVVIQPLLRLTIPLPALPGGIFGQTIPTVLFALAHAAYALGWKNALTLFGISSIISWALEQLGVAGGWIYGGYHYTGVLGIRLGFVPLLIPLSWFMYLYRSLVVVNCILGDPPISSRIKLPGHLGKPSRRGCHNGPDLVFDPISLGPLVRAWVWEQEGGYLACRFRILWLDCHGLYRFRRISDTRVALSTNSLGSSTRWFTAMPIVSYGFLMVTLECPARIRSS